MGQKQARSKTESRSRRSAGSDESEIQQPSRSRLVDIATILGVVIAAYMFYRQFGWWLTLIAILITVALALLERGLLSPESRLRRFLSHRLFRIILVTCIVLCLVVVAFINSNGSLSRKRHNQDSTEQTLVLVADFEAPDPRSARSYRVTEVLRSRLTEAFRQYPDVRVAPLEHTITERDGSHVAREQGKQQSAFIVIWGWYGTTKTSVALSTHFEVLAHGIRWTLIIPLAQWIFGEHMSLSQEVPARDAE